jgi:outer membrane protein assembly factor BamD
MSLFEGFRLKALQPLRVPQRLALRRLAMLTVSAALVACGTTSKDDELRQPPEKLYEQAKEDLANGAYDKAIKTFERIEGRATGTLLAQQAMLDQAYAQWRSGERVQAIAVLDRFIKLHPSSAGLDYAIYLKGLINFNDNLGFLSSFSRQDLSERDQQAARDAFQAFQQLIDQFPDSKYAPDARQRMDYIVNALADYELHVARYYYRRGAYVAAANRAQLAVRDFQQSPAAEEALYIMAVSYDKLGLAQLRDDADRVLKQNFPNSRYVKDGLRRPERSWWQFW